MTRIYQSASLSPQILLTLDDKASHHLARVLRAKIGDPLTIFNGKGGEYAATITQIDKKKVEVRIGDFNPVEVESPIYIHLAQGIARGEKMDFIMQKAVELGANAITPLVTTRCNVRLDKEREEKRHQHWQAIISGACEQSGRNHLPELGKSTDIKNWLPQIKADYRFILSPHEDKKLSLNIPTGSSIVLLVGPEGGFTDQEVNLAIKNGFIPLVLGKRTLRTETASLAALAALQACYGDFFN